MKDGVFLLSKGLNDDSNVLIFGLLIDDIKEAGKNFHNISFRTIRN